MWKTFKSIDVSASPDPQEGSDHSRHFQKQGMVRTLDRLGAWPKRRSVMFLQTRRTPSQIVSETTTTMTTTTHHQMIDLPKDPWGWDADDDVDGSSPSKAIASFQTFQLSSTKSITKQLFDGLIWDFLEPFLVVHGFFKTVRFL
jgi:hypothetical protein